MKEEYIFEVVERLKIPVRGHYDENGCTPAEIVRLCNEIARIEREECAKLCEENCAGYSYGRNNQGPCLTEFPKESGGRHDGMTYAAAIRSKA